MTDICTWICTWISTGSCYYSYILLYFSILCIGSDSSELQPVYIEHLGLSIITNLG